MTEKNVEITTRSDIVQELTENGTLPRASLEFFSNCTDYDPVLYSSTLQNLPCLTRLHMIMFSAYSMNFLNDCCSAVLKERDIILVIDCQNNAHDELDDFDLFVRQATAMDFSEVHIDHPGYDADLNISFFRDEYGRLSVIRSEVSTLVKHARLQHLSPEMVTQVYASRAGTDSEWEQLRHIVSDKGWQLI